MILREGFNEDGEALKRKKRKDRNTQNVVGEKDVVATMKWVICGMGSGMSCFNRWRVIRFGLFSIGRSAHRQIRHHAQD